MFFDKNIHDDKDNVLKWLCIYLNMYFDTAGSILFISYFELIYHSYFAHI